MMRNPTSGRRRRLGTVLGLAAVMVSSGALMASPAAASTNCLRGHHCVFFNGLNSAKHSYFDSDTNFNNDTFDEYGVNGTGHNRPVNDNVWAASNSSTGGYESHYYVNSGPRSSSASTPAAR